MFIFALFDVSAVTGGLSGLSGTLVSAGGVALSAGVALMAVAWGGRYVTRLFMHLANDNDPYARFDDGKEVDWDDHVDGIPDDGERLGEPEDYDTSRDR